MLAPCSESVSPASPILEKLEATRRAVRSYSRRAALLRLALIFLFLCGLLAIADWAWVLSLPLRAAGLLGLGLITAALLYRVLFLAGRHFGSEEAAAEVEAHFPALGQRVRTTVEYTEPTREPAPAHPGLVHALTTDTERRTEGLNFLDLIPWRSLRWVQATLAVLGLAAAVLLLASGELRTAALRLFLWPVEFTQLEVTPGDDTVRVGTDVTIQASLSGRPVASVDLVYRQSGSDEEWARLSLAPVDRIPLSQRKLLGNLETTLQNCQENLEYRVEAGSIQSPVYRLTVLRPLVLKQVEGTVEPPAYTRCKPTPIKEGNFSALEGSKIRLHFTLDRPPQQASLQVFASTSKERTEPAQTVPLQIVGAELTGELAALEKDLEYEIAARASDGMALDAGRFRIRVQPDRKPTIRFLKPTEQIEVTPTTEVTLRVEAGDDFGVAKVGIVYQIGNGPKKTLYLKEDPAQPVSVRAEAVLALEEHSVSFQDGVTYYAFAEDNYPTNPHRTTTELQFIDIRPYKRAYQMVEGGGGGEGDQGGC
jgi:hypothetical protein